MNMPVSHSAAASSLQPNALFLKGQPAADPSAQMGEALHGSYSQATAGVSGALGGALKEGHVAPTGAKVALQTPAADSAMGDAHQLIARSKAESAESSNAVLNMKTEVTAESMPEIQMLKNADAAAEAAAAQASAPAATGTTAAAVATEGASETGETQAAEAPAEPAEPPRPMSGRPSGVPGDPGSVPSPDDKPPEGQKMSVEDYEKCNNGVLKNLGNQEHMKDNLKARYGDWEDKSRPQADREASAFNAARHVGVIKNKLNGDGEVRSEKVTQNGKLGANKGDIRDDTEIADLKNSLKPLAVDKKGKRIELTAEQKAEQQKNTTDVLQKKELRTGHDPRVRKDGSTMNLGQYIGHKILQGLSKVLDGIKSVISNTLGKIPGIGKILAAPLEMATGALSGGLKAADAAVVHGNPKKEAQKMFHGLVKSATGAIGQASELVGNTIGKIGPVGKLLAGAVQMGSKYVSEGLNVADGAAQGDTHQQSMERLKNAGKNIAVQAVDVVGGMADQSGVVSGAVSGAVGNAIGAQSTAVKDDEVARA